MQDKVQEVCDKLEGLDSYQIRDRDIEKLETEFFGKIGVKKEEIDEVSVPDNNYELALQVASKTEGFLYWQGEETTVVWHGGGRVGEFVVSCRGGSYRCEMTIGNEGSWEATNLDWGNGPVWIKK